jgi:hypothetical protein
MAEFHNDAIAKSVHESDIRESNQSINQANVVIEASKLRSPKSKD